MSRFDPADGSRGTWSASLCLLLTCALLPALAQASRPASKLVDGSAPPAVPVELRGYAGLLIMTRVRTGTVASMRALLAGCPEVRQAQRRARVAERIGVNGRSVTFVLGRTILAACDRDPHVRAIHGPWCGTSGWDFVGGRVSDPRLDICTDRKGRAAIAFGWINPVPRARWIAVDQPGYREVYSVAGGLPVRVSTVSDLEHSGGAVFRTSQYDAQGVLLVRRKVVAAIAS